MGHPSWRELVQSKWRDLEAVERRARIESIVAQGIKRAARDTVRASLRHDVDLRATRATVSAV